jgi:hypothetical protein
MVVVHVVPLRRAGTRSRRPWSAADQADDLWIIVVAPAGSFICQVVTGWSMTVSAGDAATATQAADNMRRILVLLG